MKKLTIAFLVFLALALIIHGIAIVLINLGPYWLWLFDGV
jgi:hypothetical protein